MGGHGNGVPVRRVSTKISPLLRTSVARSVCHPRCCCDGHEHDLGGCRGVRSGSSGRADPGRAVRAGGCGAGGDRRQTAAAAAAAFAGGRSIPAGAGAVPMAWPPGGVGEADGGAGRAGPGRAVAEGAAGPAPAGRHRAGEGAVRGAGRAAGPAAHARSALRPVPDGGLRRLPVAEGPRHSPGTVPCWAR